MKREGGKEGTDKVVVLDDVLGEQVRADPDGGADDLRWLGRVELLQGVVEVAFDAQTVLHEHIGGLWMRVRRNQQW